MTAEAKESFTKPYKSENASHENPLQAPSDFVITMYENCAMTISHHDALRVIAAPVKPHPSFKIRSQLKNICSTRTVADIHNITWTFLCDCKNFWIGKLKAYANNCGNIHKANLPKKKNKVGEINIRCS